jgi:putative transposase
VIILIHSQGIALPLWRLHYHLVWATKEREPLIGERQEAVIRRVVDDTAKRMGLITHAVGVMPDHIHLAISIPPKHSIAVVVLALKGSTSRFANLESPPHGAAFKWQSEYGALSFSDRGLPDVIDYVAHQPERHASHELYTILEQVGDVDGPPSAPPGAKGPG